MREGESRGGRSTAIFSTGRAAAAVLEREFSLSTPGTDRGCGRGNGEKKRG